MSHSMNMVAVDLGAGSGRVILGRFDGNTLALEETGRFPNMPVYAGGTLYWDILGLYREIKQGLRRTGGIVNGGIASIGIDAWGNDFGLLDKNGFLIGNPVHYRDDRTKGMMERVFEIVPKESVFKQTGIQFMRFNGLYQLFSLAHSRQPALETADKLLPIPDLIRYFLTGVCSSEFTVATTTQMVSSADSGWAFDMLSALGMPTRIFTELVSPGAFAGRIADEDCEHPAFQHAKVVAVAEHDTASAVVAVPAESDTFAYISSGTWSLMGTETEKPVINELTYRYNFTNEGGAFGTNRLLKNVMGLWILQECRRYWESAGEDCGYERLEEEARKAAPFKCFIDPDDGRFEEPGDMPRKVASFCRETGQKPPESKGEYVRCIRESLALKYRYVLDKIEEITGKRYPAVHIMGGGALDSMLCGFTANATGRRVIAGPAEATAIGNMMMQAAAFGEIGGLRDLRQIIRQSFCCSEYQPDDKDGWNNSYESFKKCLLEISASSSIFP